MTRKDYVLIANALRAAMISTPSNNGAHAWNNGIWMASIELADALQSDNPRFNRERFLNACEDSE